MSSIDESCSRRSSLTYSLSPIPRIKQLFHLKAVAAGHDLPRLSVHLLPTKLILYLGGYISSPRDILSLSLTCRRAREALSPRLYATVELKTNRQCKTALEAFTRHPEITEHIQTLIVRPNNVERTAPGDYLDETLVADLIIQIAGHLPAIRSFRWDGLEMPDDRLWLNLRKLCSNIKCVGTSVGSLPLNSSNPLFDFRDLLELSFVVKCASLTWLLDGPPEVEKLPRKFWQMLLEHCPNLEELTIGGPAPSPRLFDTRHITAGRWPRLRRLTLGDMVLIPLDQKKKIRDGDTLDKFLIAHPLLQDIAFQYPGGKGHGFPHFLTLPHFALPKIESFSGPPKYVKSLPHPTHLKNLTITTLHHALSSFPRTCTILHGLPSLISLKICIDFTFTNRGILHNDENIFRTLLDSCPQLLHLEILCFTRPTFHVREFSAALRYSPQLRSFSLTKIYKPSDDDMMEIAAHIAQENPNIHKFSLRYSHDSWLTHNAGRVKRFGDYEVLTGVDGPPKRLLAYEWGVRSFGQTYSRTYSHTLRPSKPRQHSWPSHPSYPVSERAQSPRPRSIVSFQGCPPFNNACTVKYYGTEE